MTLTAAGNDSGRRLDRILRKALPGIPLSALYRLFRKGAILVDGKPASGADRVIAGSVIQIPGNGENPGPADSEHPAKCPDSARTGPLPEILFEGSGLLVLNKPAGLAVHGPDRDNLNVRVQTYLENRIPGSLSFRPGPLHRLDKPTSGIVVFSTSLEGAKSFCKLLSEGKVVKVYLAVLEGSLEKEVVWKDTLFRDKKSRKSLAGGDSQQNVTDSKIHPKKAVTRVRPAARSKGATLAFIEPETGRTHQIRAQAAFHNFPLRGDHKYGGGGKGGFFLHALSLEFPPEETPRLPRQITAPLPETFLAFVRENFDDAVRIFSSPATSVHPKQIQQDLPL